jgi:enoyl-CoA hydratase/carnithine racemase
MTLNKEIDFTEMPGRGGALGIITLQRPHALNALNHAMLLAIQQHLKNWAAAPSIKAVLVRAVPGRAFCAGGDIREAYEKKIKNDPSLPDFFRDEYQVNKQIFHFPKPYIALLDGLTMGGGAGISIHGSHRVATSHMSFAMPETGIGFFPDVGASYFLPRLPHKTGYYLGLTGERIAYHDCAALGLIDAVISSEAQEPLIHEFIQTALSDKNAVSDSIKKFSSAVPPSDLLSHQDSIQHCFSKNSIEEIIQALASTDSAWCHHTAEIIKTKSPSSLKITLRALQQGSQLDFDACMRMEDDLLLHFLESHDFFEGIRAAIIDKDHAPRWRPRLLSAVDESGAQQR